MAAFAKHTLSPYWAREVRHACVSEENENVKGETGDGSYMPKFGESSLKLAHDLVKTYSVPEITSLGSDRLSPWEAKACSPSQGRRES